LQRLLVILGMGLACSASLAQDLVITGARILDGKGGVIDRGSLVVRDGRIEAVRSGSAAAANVETLDAGGMTLMPGFIDAHRHLIQGEPAVWLEERSAASMRDFLAAGFTTVLSAIDDTPTIVELRRRIADGETEGPRLVVGGFVPLAINPPLGPPGVDPARLDNSRPPHRPTEPARAIPEEQTRAAVRAHAAAGVDAIKTVITVTPGGPEQDTLRIVIDEAAQHGLPTITHAVSVIDTMAAVEAGTTTLVHTPHIGILEEAETRRIVDSGIPMTSTLGVFVPYFSESNEPLFRDLGPFPQNTLSSAGVGPVNARLLWDAGITYGYGTDTSYPARDSLAHELRPLGLVFSPADIVKIITSQAAVLVGLESEIGSLEPGMIADLVLIDGDPLEDIDALLNVKLVAREGRILVDAR
jgi:imidazolonepropionase-like amidohydrolase